MSEPAHARPVAGAGDGLAPTPPTPASVRLPALRGVWLAITRRIDSLWGYDVFIAHRRGDAAEYAYALFLALRQQKPKVNTFIDRAVYGPGESLTVATLRHIRKSTLLVLLASPELLALRKEDWVATELDDYLRTHQTDPIVVVVDFGETIAKGDDHPIVGKVSNFLRVSAEAQELTLPPSDEVIRETLARLGGRRRDRLRQRIFGGVAVGFAALLLAAAAAAYTASERSHEATTRFGAALGSQAQTLLEQPVTRTSAATIAALASEAWRVAPNSDAWNALQRLPWTGSETSAEHQGDVTAVRFSPDGSVLASASVDGTVKLIDVSSGVVRRSFAHEGWVNALAFSHDGRFFASGSGNSARIFRTDGSREQQMLAFQGPVYTVAFDPSGRFFASGSDDHSVLIMEMANGAVRVRLHQEGAVRALTFSPDGSMLAIGDWHGVVKLVSTATMSVVGGRRITNRVSSVSSHINQIAFNPVARQPFILAVADDDGARILAATESLGELVLLPEVGGAVNTIAFSPDGLLVAEGGNDRAARIARSEDGFVLTTVLHGGRVNDVAFSRDGRWLATGGEDSFVRLVETPREDRRKGDPDPRAPVRAAISNGEKEVTTIAFSPDGRFLATGGRDHHARIFPIRAGLTELRWLPEPAETRALAFSPDGRYLGVGDGTGAAVYDISSGKQLARLGHGNGVNSIAFSRDQRWVAYGDDEGTVEVWSANGGDAILTPGMKLSEAVSNVSFSADGRFLGIAGLLGTIRLVTTANWKHSDFVHAQENVFVAGFSPDSLYFVVGAEPFTGDGVIRRWRLDSQTSLRELPPISPGHWIRGLSFASDGLHAIVGTNTPQDHSEVVVVQLDTGQQVSRLSGGPVVAASPRGDLIATGTADGTVTVSTLRSRRQHNLLTRVGSVATLAFSPDSELLAVGDGDGAARVLRVRDGVEAIRITHNGGVSVLAFSPDGTLLATGGDTRDRSVRLWSTDADRLVRDLCTGPGQNPDPSYWRHFFGNLAWKRTCPGWLPKDVSAVEK